MAGFNPDYTGLGELLRSEGVKRHLKHCADKIADAARATSPVGPLDDHERTRYRDSWEVSTDEKAGSNGIRARATVSNPTPYAAAIEYGNGRTRRKTIEPHYTLTRAIDAARE